MKALGKKQTTGNHRWLETLSCIESLVSVDELTALTATTVKDIQEITADKKSAYAWSGGKDSIVLDELCRAAGVVNAMIGVCNLEYPAFMGWVNSNKPDGCEIINTGQDLDWLVRHPEMLFPRESKTAARWFSIVQHRAQREYFKAHQLDILILGRRKADGNYVGNGTNIYTDGKGVTRYSPLADWTHEHILAYIHYHRLSLPPIYGWHNGYLCGTHPWPARQWTENEQSGWQEVFNIDKGIVATAADKLSGARSYMEGLNNENC